MQASAPARPFVHHPAIKVLVFIAALVVTIAWLRYTPSGIFGKADAIGYAFCHRIDTHSFSAADRQLPFCSRDTGMYNGAALAILFILAVGRKRYSGLPTRLVLVAFGLFVAYIAVDGFNSLANDLPQVSARYLPNNWLRLTSGLGMGFAMAGMIYPIFAGAFWTRPIERPIFDWVHLVILLIIGIVFTLLIASQQTQVLQFFGLLSALGVMSILTMIYAVLFMTFTNTFNRGQSWQDAIFPMTVGYTLALGQVFFIDFLRFSVTGTWGGFVF